MRMHALPVALILAAAGLFGGTKTFGNEPKDIVIMVTGQSNASGRGRVNEQEMPANVTAWHARTNSFSAMETGVRKPWKLENNSKGDSPSIYLAKRLAALHPKKNIRIIECAVGSQSIKEWAPGKRMWVACVSRAKAALAKLPNKQRVDGIVWHQGEHDQGMSRKVYRERFNDLLKRLRARTWFGTDNVVIIGRIPMMGPKQNQTFTQLAYENRDVIYLDQIKVLKNAPSSMRDAVHWDSEGGQYFGERAADHWDSWHGTTHTPTTAEPETEVPDQYAKKIGFWFDFKKFSTLKLSSNWILSITDRANGLMLSQKHLRKQSRYDKREGCAIMADEQPEFITPTPIEAKSISAESDGSLVLYCVFEKLGLGIRDLLTWSNEKNQLSLRDTNFSYPTKAKPNSYAIPKGKVILKCVVDGVAKKRTVFINGTQVSSVAMVGKFQATGVGKIRMSHYSFRHLGDRLKLYEILLFNKKLMPEEEANIDKYLTVKHLDK